jgi:hypothetical protein
MGERVREIPVSLPGLRMSVRDAGRHNKSRVTFHGTRRENLALWSLLPRYLPCASSVIRGFSGIISGARMSYTLGNQLYTVRHPGDPTAPCWCSLSDCKIYFRTEYRVQMKPRE